MLKPDSRVADVARPARPVGITNSVDPMPARSFYIFLVLACVAGAALRLAYVSSQVLLDDEWHAMDYAIGNSLGFLLTHFSVPGATCIPINAYTWALLHSVGWNETLLRLPALIPGIGALFVLPRVVRRISSRPVTVIFTWLLAISPFLVFYSRIARPYAMVALAGAAAVFYGYLWLVSGRRSAAVIYVAYGIAAVYFHVFAIVSVTAPILCALCIKLMPSRFASARGLVRPSYRELSSVIAVFACALGILLLPAVIQGASGALSSVAGAGDMTAATFTGFASMLAGTSSTILIVVFWCLLAIGFLVISRNARLLALIVLANAVGYGLSLAIARPILINTPLVLSRYVVAAFPLCLFLVALGIDGIAGALAAVRSWGRLIGWIRPSCALASALFVGALFLEGPVPGVYYRPNNFTGHSAFIESYAPLDWDHSYRSQMLIDGPVISGVASFSSFYPRLAADSRVSAIIEFPMFVGNHFNLYYYYQHFHKKRIFVGYFPDFDLRAVSSKGWIDGSTYADFVLSREHDRVPLKMSNMVDVTDLDAVRRSGASFLILHRHLPIEMFPQAVGPGEPDYAPVEYLTSVYKQRLGDPEFEDANLVVFRIGSSPATAPPVAPGT